MQLNEILAEINNSKDLEALEKVKKKYIGKKGLINMQFKELKNFSVEEKKEKGQELAIFKKNIEDAINKKYNEIYKKHINEKLENDIFDITLDNFDYKKGNYGIQLGFRRYIEDVLQSMGFRIESSNELVSTYQNFFSVNIPKDHPAVEMQDTFYLEQLGNDGENLVLRTHTSSWQNNVMKKYGAPCRVMLPGRTFRNENTDSSHDTTFWQLEGLVIDENISLSNLVGFLEEFFEKVFGEAVKIRLRPAYFPFVEPGFEGDVSCPICKGKGCSLCSQTGRIEIFGAGMIHPNVLKEGGIDLEKYRGFAFGLGITRIVAIKYGIKDIRLFNSGDLRFFNLAL